MTATTRKQVETAQAAAIGRKLSPGIVDVADLVTDEATGDPLARPSLAHRRSA